MARRRRAGLSGVGTVALLASLLSVAPPALGPERTQADAADATDADMASIDNALDRLPLGFEPNVGQAHGDVRFLTRGKGTRLFLTAQESVLRVGGDDVVRMRLLGADDTVTTEGLDPLAGKVNYYSGSDPAKWRSDIPTYAKVAYRDVYPGIDAVYYGKQGQLEYDFVVDPGADPKAIALGFDGPESAHIDGQGDLVLAMESSEVRHRRPVVYQDGPEGREHVPAHYAMDGERVSFALGRYDESRPLVIDPLVYSTFYGGTNYDQGMDVAVDRDGNAIVSGRTESTDYPTKNPVPGTGDDGTGHDDAFVTKFNRDGSALVYSTYLNGKKADHGKAVDVDGAGNAYVTGYASSGFPTTSGALRSCSVENPIFTAFVTKLAPTGALVYSTCVGGTGADLAVAIAVDASGNATVTGTTESSDFPTTPGAFQPDYHVAPDPNDSHDAFVAKLNSTGTGLVWATYLGGVKKDLGQGLTVDASGVYVAGYTTSTDFPTVGSPYQSSLRGPGDVFVTKFNHSGGALWSTYLGGSGFDGHPQFDVPLGLAVDGGGRPYVADSTRSTTDFPTTQGVLQPTHGGGPDGFDLFVTKLNANGSGLVYSTYLGGTDDDGQGAGVGVAVDGSGSAYVSTATGSTNLPTLHAAQSGHGGFVDVYIAKLNPTASGLSYATYLGGTVFETIASGIDVDPDGNAYLAGATTSPNFPTTNGAYRQVGLNLDPSKPNASSEGFLSKLDPALGFLRITTNPALPSQVTVDGVPRATYGTINLEASPGAHQVCFRDVEGFAKPACQSVNVANGMTTQVTGNFVAKGFLQVVTNPALPAKITVNDVARDDWGIYTDYSVGSYRVCFGKVKDYSPPACRDVNVTAGQTTTVTGNYTLNPGAAGEPAGNGALRVTTNPALPSQISVDGIPRSTYGLINLQIAPGAHQVCFRDVEGFNTPACRTVNITAGQTTTTEGKFDPKGFLQVVTSPALPGAIYVDGIPRDDWGIFTDLPVGAHEVCFGAVWGYRSPPCKTVNLTGPTVTVTGSYTAE